MELTVVFNTDSLSFSELEAVLRHGPWCGDVPSPIRNLETTTATATRTFKNNMSALYRIVKFHLSR